MAMTPEESFALATQQEPSAAEQQAAGEYAPEPAPPAPAAEPAPAAPSDDKRYNPNWDEAWADVPEPIRAAQRPAFEKWDANYNKLDAQYAPYRKFEQQGYNPQYLESAIDIQRALIENPQDFVERAIREFGLTVGQAQQAVQQAAQAAEGEFLDPAEERLRRLEAAEEARLQQWEQQQAQQQEQYNREQGARQVQQAIGALHEKYGDFNDERLVLWATGNAQSGRNPDLEVALNEMFAYEAEIVQRNARTAPRLNGTSAQVAPIQQAPEPRKIATHDELLARALAMKDQFGQ